MAKTPPSKRAPLWTKFVARSPAFYFLVIVFIAAIIWMAWDISQNKPTQDPASSAPTSTRY